MRVSDATGAVAIVSCNSGVRPATGDGCARNQANYPGQPASSERGLVRCSPLSSHNRRGDRVSRAEQATDALDRAAETMNDDADRESPTRRGTVAERLKTSPRLGGSGAGPGWLMGSKPPPPGSKLLLPPRDEVVLKPSFAVAVLAGGFASATVDVTIFPLDSLKTRLQAPQGFQRAGGTTGLFRGVLAAAVGAMPGGAVFFGVYEYTRHVAQGGAAPPHWTTDAVAATIAATASCLVRNPAVVVTQRMQVGQYGTLPSAVATMWRTEGAMGFYAGLQVSVLRELPFAFIQFPLYESLKRLLRRSQQHDISASQGAVCGSISGAVAAAATTPLDLMKTRVMLGGADGSALSILGAMARVWLQPQPQP